MFKTKKDRRVVEVAIEFNITAIGEWLKAGGKFEEIDKIKGEERGAWGDAVIQKYVIDILPMGQTSDAYFHRNKGIISQNIGGIDFLENAEEDVKYIAEKETKIEVLQWEMWRGCLGLKANKNLILLTPPLTEVIELETKGVLSKSGGVNDEDVKIKVPISFNDDKSPKEFMEIWRGSASDKSLGYGNSLAHVSFSTLNYEVEY